MAQDPSQVRQAIEQDRLELADTVQALAQKADIKHRVRETVVIERRSATPQGRRCSGTSPGTLPRSRFNHASARRRTRSGSGLSRSLLPRQPSAWACCWDG
jgi:hypothetical protein